MAIHTFINYVPVKVVALDSNFLSAQYFVNELTEFDVKQYISQCFNRVMALIRPQPLSSRVKVFSINTEFSIGKIFPQCIGKGKP